MVRARSFIGGLRGLAGSFIGMGGRGQIARRNGSRRHGNNGSGRPRDWLGRRDISEIGDQLIGLLHVHVRRVPTDFADGLDAVW